ncbi:UNVERIFIED_CONTAM: hypothetical protein NY603_28210, partial [Bacteroidetes bacterium 56_B9]
EQQDIERLHELAVLDVEIAAIGSDLAIHNLIFSKYLFQQYKTALPPPAPLLMTPHRACNATLAETLANSHSHQTPSGPAQRV